METKTMHWEGLDYETAGCGSENSCEGCAFEHVLSGACDSELQRSKLGESCYGGRYIFVEKSDERVPADTKPTNPKDAIGIQKAPMSTVSGAVLAEIGVAMLDGACKYGRHNYRAIGVRSSVYYDATMRHLLSWWEGEDIDPDSGLSHVTKAITSLVVLRDAMIQEKVTDDRPPRSKPFMGWLNEHAKATLQKYMLQAAPKHYTLADEVTA
jgi:hypothetical protein